MHKFFVDSKMIGTDKITITGEDVNHITNVLRLKSGEEIQICNGKGKEYLCTVSEISKKIVVCDIINSYDNKTEPPVEVILYQGLPKAQKMDFIIQKCVEIGVSAVQPVISSRVVVKIEGKEITGKIDRWNRIAEEAAKQSNRGIIPEVFKPVKLMDAYEMASENTLNIIPYEKENNSGIRTIFQNKKNISKVGIFIGPEGGFEENEIQSAVENGIIPVTLGPRILRTETAGLTASAFVLYETGDMGGKCGI